MKYIKNILALVFMITAVHQMANAQLNTEKKIATNRKKAAKVDSLHKTHKKPVSRPGN